MTRQEAATRMEQFLVFENSDFVNCGEVDLTRLAERTVEDFDEAFVGGPLDDPDHWIWELAVEVASWHEHRGIG